MTDLGRRRRTFRRRAERATAAWELFHAQWRAGLLSGSPRQLAEQEIARRAVAIRERQLYRWSISQRIMELDKRRRRLIDEEQF